ncbi:hypothetical protein TTHERM_01014650 (macronuclear) [Tetrahymena thermophila SB210]|uniref:Uncharacterized protein n=1 Tax=Tetrahymena thermophila (strain SB210) TaxID=312017 RepID=Q22CX1_TETTS|nr:hypothetical protein TTHERM_01014650 [Tetrahymena thermophila SB210]EAR83148.2 hypothetical protein TTHERM_01014650 [Tetrahymena thermophila SB210]|eukprot:XP_001030811.2 hypothetical protein TTHERM_01014650 [Tetrahymena thermophila SB210]
MINSNPQNYKLSFQAYDELIKSSRSVSPNSSFLSNQDDLLQERKMSSQAQILKAFNSIRDMNNKEQINQALLMIPNVKDRIMLVEKLLERREQIAKAKEMQAINNLAPLFNKIKLKFLNSLQKANATTSERKHKFQKNISQGIQNQQNQNEVGLNNMTNQQQQGDIQINQIKSPNKTVAHKIQNASPNTSPNVNKIADIPKDEENSNQIQQQNKNIMGAITIFATHDIKMDKEKEEIDKKMKQNKPLGYLQRDNFLKMSIVAQEDRLKSPSKSNMLISNTSQKSNNISNNIASSEPSNTGNQQKKKQEKSAPLTKSLNLGETNEIDYGQKMEALKKKMFLVNHGVGRRDSPSSSSNKHSRKRSLNISPASQYNFQNSDFVKDDASQKYYFKPQLNSFSQATQNYQSQSINFQNNSNQSMHSLIKKHQSKQPSQNSSNNGVLFDFILECEQKRYLSKNNLPGIDQQIILRKHHSSQSSIKPSSKLQLFQSQVVQSKLNSENSTHLLHKMYQMQREHSISSLKFNSPKTRQHHVKSQSINIYNQVA